MLYKISSIALLSIMFGCALKADLRPSFEKAIAKKDRDAAAQIYKLMLETGSQLPTGIALAGAKALFGSEQELKKAAAAVEIVNTKKATATAGLPANIAAKAKGNPVQAVADILREAGTEALEQALLAEGKNQANAKAAMAACATTIGKM